MHPLAIVIPAYKSVFFDKALSSLAYQTNKNFTVYVGDDCSPESLEDITEQYKSRLDIHYTRFENNIGAKYLVHQWDRCIQLTKGEPWLWLFSDDDIADANCVETFYNTITEDNNRFDVYRFNTRVINDEDEVIDEAMESPCIDNAYDMAIAILKGERGNSMPDHIFSRKVFEEKGFVHTDYAQSADWAISILFSQDKGICTMRPAKVDWRLGIYNISGMASNKKENMVKGYFQFLNWLITHFDYLKATEQGKFKTLVDATEYNLRQLIQRHYKRLPLQNITDVYAYYSKVRTLPWAIVSTLKLYKSIHKK